MTPKDAIYYMKILIEYLREEVGISIQMLHALDMATESLQKHVATEPTHEATKLNDTTCPSCKNVLDNDEKDYNHSYCHFCGQKLDWRDSK